MEYRFVNYPRVTHAFSNPEATERGKRFGLSLAYRAKTDKQSRKEMRKFLAAVFGGK